MSSVLWKLFSQCRTAHLMSWNIEKNTVRRTDSYRDNTVKRSLFFKQSDRLSTAASKVSSASITYPYQERLSILTKTFKKVTFKNLQFIKGTDTYWKPVISPEKTPTFTSKPLPWTLCHYKRVLFSASKRSMKVCKKGIYLIKGLVMAHWTSDLQVTDLNSTQAVVTEYYCHLVAVSLPK